MSQVLSTDGTRIAYERMGNGPAVIIVNGAMGYRAFYGDRPLASALSQHFTVYIYDRRGRGESTDVKPYAVEREIEDIEALIDDAGGRACLYGVSSGAALALQAAVTLGNTKVSRLALYEPPYGQDTDKDRQDFAAQRKQLNELIRHGNRGDAAAFFISALGTPPEALEGLRRSPEWPFMESVEHTLAYDYAVLGDGAVPVEIARNATMPVLVMNGEKSFAFMRDAAETLSKALPHSQWHMLRQTHEVSHEVLAPVLTGFFRERSTAT